MTPELTNPSYNDTVHNQTLTLVLSPDVHNALVNLALNASRIVDRALDRLPDVAAKVCGGVFFVSTFFFYFITPSAHEQAVLPLIESARTNCRELVAELFREYAWPVLGACVATQITILLLFACLYKCAHMALAHRYRPRAGVQAPRDEESSRGIETRDL